MSPKKRFFWEAITEALVSDDLSFSVQNLFETPLKKKYKAINLKTKTRLELIRDQAGYEIKPHTDAPHKILTLLFYLPKDNSLREYGTSIYEPKKKNFIDNSGLQHPFHLFNEVKMLPFIPNSLFGFMKNESSFHGRATLKGLKRYRDWMNCSIQLETDFIP